MTTDPRQVVADIIRDAGLPLGSDELDALAAGYPAHRQVIESMYAVPMARDEPMHLAAPRVTSTGTST